MATDEMPGCIAVNDEIVRNLATDPLALGIYVLTISMGDGQDDLDALVDTWTRTGIVPRHAAEAALWRLLRAGLIRTRDGRFHPTLGHCLDALHAPGVTVTEPNA